MVRIMKNVSSFVEKIVGEHVENFEKNPHLKGK